MGAVNELSGPSDYVMTASGGLPGELVGGWRAVGGAPTIDVEYGFSCMGYEIAGAWGAAMAQRDRAVTTLLGDGAYLTSNSELFSAAFAGHPFVAVVCDNDGSAVIARLQQNQGCAAFDNFYANCLTTRQSPPRVDFAGHAAALGRSVLTAHDVDEFGDALVQARAAAKAGAHTAVVVVRTQPSTWTETGAWWELGVPPELPGRADYDEEKPRQVRYVRR
ncbi:thiamine pyrophosphate-dependent enzyme [Nocardia sp. CNY236]|uniref:thiamine pyrophosphate-dependent enzyme n=1 Tax=Nocardia sp. CNY236 TaxID=1169152 RepID=UPI0003FFC114|nr:thiamine pyrophosphate-dependent enzyme [Nocardia sp. CNY236]